ncbi:MAG: aldo/keto reductase, partial [Eubacteriales bacterium]|nr:aldo/keto reductase [Eubacteriales bacterium]
MEYRKIEGVKKPVSRILFGTAQESFIMNNDNDQLLDAVTEMGINTFDIARGYGHAEDVVGRWVQKRGNREDVVLLSKCGHPTPDWTKRVTEKDMKYDLDLSLKSLQTDYIDIYLLHRDDPDIDVAVPVETFNEMHAEGKIGAFGGSNWTHQRIEEANEYAYKHNLVPFTVSSPNFGLADQVRDPWGGGCITISGKANADAREFYVKTQIPVIAYSSLGRGLFSGKLKSENA